MCSLDAVIIKVISKRALIGSSFIALECEVTSKQEFEAEAELPAATYERVALWRCFNNSLEYCASVSLGGCKGSYF